MPNFAVRSAVILTVLIMAYDRLSVVKRQHVFALFLGIFYLSYVFPPYWNLFGGLQYKLIAAILISVSGALWAYWVSGDLVLNKRRVDITAFILIAAIMLSFNWRAIHSDIAWMGDEDYHISTVLTLGAFLNKLPTKDFFHLGDIRIKLTLFALALSVFLLLYNYRKNISAYLRSAAIYSLATLPIICIFIITILSNKYLNSLMKDALRYPYLQKWLGFAATYNGVYNDELYRLVPFLSGVLLCWYVYQYLTKHNKYRPISFALTLCVASIPLSVYFTSILYMEMPAVLLMTVCVLNIDSLVKHDFRILKKEPCWYCFLLLGFLKETTVVFTVIVLSARFIYQSMRHFRNKDDRRRIIKGYTVYPLALFPAAFYIIIRMSFRFQKHYGGIEQLTRIIDPANYVFLINALVTQYGIIMVIAVIGMMWLLLGKERKKAMLLALIFLATLIFFMVFRPMSCMGLPRWNMMVMPIVLYFFLRYIVSLNTFMRVVISIAILAFNVAMYPLHLDGSRKPNWASVRTDYYEYTYPYDEAIDWLCWYNRTHHILVMGHYYHYNGLQFYFNKHYGKRGHMMPNLMELYYGNERFDKKEEILRFHAFFHGYNNGNVADNVYKADTILYHSVNNIILDDNILYGNVFKIAKKFSNEENSLYVLFKQ